MRGTEIVYRYTPISGFFRQVTATPKIDQYMNTRAQVRAVIRTNKLCRGFRFNDIDAAGTSHVQNQKRKNKPNSRSTVVADAAHNTSIIEANTPPGADVCARKCAGWERAQHGSSVGQSP